VWRREGARLWRYRAGSRAIATPILIAHSLVSRSYILDLLPGNSMVEFLGDEGFDVFLLDWAAAGPSDAGNTLETYADGYVPAAVEATIAEAGADELTLVGYCLGGVLTLLSAAARPGLAIRNLVTLTTPCDYRAMGFMAKMFSSGRLDPDDVIDEFGLVPAGVLDEGFQAMKPTDRLVQQVNLFQHLGDEDWLQGFYAMSRWARDQVPFAGAAFRQVVERLIRANALLEGVIPFGRGEVRLEDIRVPYLTVYCEDDEIVPAAAAAPLVGLVGSADASELVLESGHVGLVAGRSAAKVSRPRIADWILARAAS
jgi:polyhydroxyalkanoate synthase